MIRDLLERLGVSDARAQGRRDPLGPRGERIAARMLRRKGCRVLERNVRLPIGEADLVCLGPDRRTIVIVEVKARRIDPPAPGAGSPERRPEAAVGVAKRRKLVRIAEVLARRRGWTDRPLRIDVVAVDIPPRGRPVVRHHEAAVVGR